MQNSQSGSALAISLVILTAITLISISSLERSGLQTKIVANIQHQEKLYTACNSEQEHWFSKLQNSISGDSLLAQPLREYVLSAEGEKTYSPVELDLNKSRPFVETASEILFTPPKLGQIALAVDEEVNQRINYRFNLDCQASVTATNKVNNQRSGINFPGLNSSQHSKI